MLPDRQLLFDEGQKLMLSFCQQNDLPAPKISAISAQDWLLGGTCAYYRSNNTFICLSKCATVGVAGRSWSWPGYTVDRTPYGVLQHELGHHVDVLSSGIRRAYSGDFSVKLRREVKEEPISSYCPNDAEWFAELFRVFVTNPDLLSRVRPKTFRALERNGLQPVVHVGWRKALAWNAPERTVDAAERKIQGADAAERRAQRKITSSKPP